MEVTKELLSARLADLREQEARALSAVWLVRGAIAEVEYQVAALTVEENDGGS